MGFRAFYGNRALADEYVRGFEAKVGAHYFNDQDTVELARVAVEKLKDTLSTIIRKELEKADPAAETEQEAEDRARRAFFRDDVMSAGQVGTGVPYEELLQKGNVRELMTAFFNAAYYNSNTLPSGAAGSVDTLQKKVISGAAERALAAEPTPMPTEDGHDAAPGNERQRDELRRVGRWLGSHRRRAVSWLKGFARDPFATGNVAALSASPRYQWFTLMASVLGRRTIGGDEVQPRTPKYYADAGTPLGELEQRFVARHLDLAEDERLPDGQPLPWREGAVALRPISNPWSRRVRSFGIPVQTGISTTTARMLLAAKLIGLDPQQQETFLGALMAWMLPGKDHTLFEIQRGAGIAGLRIDGRDPSSSRYTFVDAYQNLPGKPKIGDVRAMADESALPHDRLYDDAMASGRIAEHGADWLTTVHDVFDEYVDDPDLANFNAMYEDFENSLDHDAGLTPEQGDAKRGWRAEKEKLESLKKVIDLYREENGLSVDEFKLLLSKRHRQALTAWTGPLFPLLNDAMKYRHSWNPAKRLLGYALFRRKVGMMVGEGRILAFSYASKMPQALVSEQFERAKQAPHSAAEWKRYQNELPALRRRLYEEISWQSDMAYDALQQLPKVGKESKPVMVFRGERASAGVGVWRARRSWAKGRRLRQLLSFSRSKAIADNFRDGVGMGLLIVAKLVGKYARDIAPFSSAVHESEVLLPPGAHLAPMAEGEAAEAATAAGVNRGDAVFVKEA
ncbi:hypothetical protein [Streptomyces sp. NPDC000878]